MLPLTCNAPVIELVTWQGLVCENASEKDAAVANGCVWQSGRSDEEDASRCLLAKGY